MVAKFVFWSLVLLVLVVYTGIRASWTNQFAKTPPFTHWQGQYREVALALATTPAVRDVVRGLSTSEVKNITVIQFPLIESDGTQQQRVDRCQSCHIGLENPQMTAENIIKVVDKQTVPTDKVAEYLESHPKTRTLVKTIGAHPGLTASEGDKTVDLGVTHSPLLSYGVATNSSPTEADKDDYKAQKANLSKHAFATFGCTTCHYGSGRELQQNEAHGKPSTWVQSMLPAKYMEAACAQCHAAYSAKPAQTPGVSTIAYLPEHPGLLARIARGEQLFRAQACYGCHKIDGYSKGNIGPELTYEGRKATIASVEHQLWDPRYKTGSCAMPYFFALRERNTDDPVHQSEVVDKRVKGIRPAEVSEEIAETLHKHGYVPNADRQEDVDALVTFVVSQTGQNFAASQSSRFATVSAYNQTGPADVPVTAAAGKRLFEQSGCYACHYIAPDADKKHETGDPRYGKGGVIGPELSWEGTRHSQQWMIAHYENPQAFVPGSIMPIFPLSNSQRAALSLYDGSQKPKDRQNVTVSPAQDMPSAAQKRQGAQTPDIRYALPLGQTVRR